MQMYTLRLRLARKVGSDPLLAIRFFFVTGDCLLAISKQFFKGVSCTFNEDILSGVTNTFITK